MLEAIRNFAGQISQSLDIIGQSNLKKLGSKKPRFVFFAGMGGSSLPADMVNDYLDLEEPLRLLRDYQLPTYAGKKDVVICSSYSGNTEETLSVLAQALRRDCRVVVMSHGGELKKLAEKKQLPFILIPDSVQPRCAVGNFFVSTLAILEQLKLIAPQAKKMRALAQFLEARRTRHEEMGKNLAQHLKGLVPVVYGPTTLASICRIWKIKFNENAKIQSFWNVYPELNHNEMVGYTQLLMKPAVVHLQSNIGNPRILRRMEVVEKMLGPQLPFFAVRLEGKNILEEMFDAHAVGDFTSYYLAKEYGVDPAPVAMVEDFKKQLD